MLCTHVVQIPSEALYNTCASTETQAIMYTHEHACRERVHCVKRHRENSVSEETDGKTLKHIYCGVIHKRKINMLLQITFCP